MFDEIVSLEEIGEENVYDLEIDSEFHNFYANGVVVHNCAYAYIAWQCLYFKTYYPAYFYCACLNQESDTDEIKLVINFAKVNGIKVKPISINKSEYLSTVESDNVIRLGYKLLKGMGESAQGELKTLKLNECKTIFEVLEKPFKKINSTALNNLIDLGCFDELDENRNRIKKLFVLYKEPKIEKWFTRKRNPIELKTMPEILSSEFDTDTVLGLASRFFNDKNPHFKLIQHLSAYYDKLEYNKEQIEEDTINKEKELLGFQMTISSYFEEFINRISQDGFKPITQVIKENDGEDFFTNCYFQIMGCEVAFTKTNKPFLKFILNDGQKDYKANMWINTPQQEAMIPKYKSAQFGIGNLKKNDFGYNVQKLEIPEI